MNDETGQGLKAFGIKTRLPFRHSEGRPRLRASNKMRLSKCANKNKAPQVKECFMERGQSFVGCAQSLELMQPGDSAFAYPPGLAQVAAIRSSAFNDPVSDSLRPQCHAVCTTVVSTIGMNRIGLFQWSPAFCSDGVDAIDQWQQLPDVMPGSLGQSDIDRDASRIDAEVVLAARLTVIG